MAQYGQLQANPANARYPFKGKAILPSGTFEFALRLKTDDERSSQNSPTHTIVCKNPSGDFYDAGVAWLKVTEEGKPFFSLQFDHPELPCEVRVSAFQSDNDPHVFDVVWTRQRGAGKKAGVAGNAQDSAVIGSGQ